MKVKHKNTKQFYSDHLWLFCWSSILFHFAEFMNNLIQIRISQDFMSKSKIRSEKMSICDYWKKKKKKDEIIYHRK